MTRVRVNIIIFLRGQDRKYQQGKLKNNKEGEKANTRTNQQEKKLFLRVFVSETQKQKTS